MLRQRVITALVLVGILFTALAAPSPWPFALVTLALLAAGAWEWGRLNQAGPGVSLALGALLAAGGLAVVAGLLPAQPGAAGWWATVAAWVLFAALALSRGPAAWPRWPPAARWLIGLVLLAFAWSALIGARAIGVNFLLSMLCVVWMADIAAYFGGRRFGRRKLAPSVSPGKSWEGVWSGMAGVVALAVFWHWLDTQFSFDSASLYTRLARSLGWPLAVLTLLGLAAMSVVGDLVESLVKRAAGAKDSSRLLPGHGGVLDRVDALLPVMPATLAVLSLSPAR